MAVEEVTGAVKIAGAGLGDHADGGTRGATVFSGLRVREHFELGDLVNVHGGELTAVGTGVDIGDAVDHEVILVVAVSVDGAADAAGGDNAGDGAGEVKERSTVEGEVNDLIAGEDATFFRAAGLEDDAGGFDGNGLGDVSDGEGEIWKIEAIAGGDADLVAFDFTKAGGFDDDLVEGRLQRVKEKDAFLVRLHFAIVALGNISKRYFCAGNDSALNVFDGAAKGTRGLLTQCDSAERDQSEERAQYGAAKRTLLHRFEPLGFSFPFINKILRS